MTLAKQFSIDIIKCGRRIKSRFFQYHSGTRQIHPQLLFYEFIEGMQTIKHSIKLSEHIIKKLIVMVFYDWIPMKNCDTFMRRKKQMNCACWYLMYFINLLIKHSSLLIFFSSPKPCYKHFMRTVINQLVKIDDEIYCF